MGLLHLLSKKHNLQIPDVCTHGIETLIVALEKEHQLQHGEVNLGLEALVFFAAYLDTLLQKPNKKNENLFWGATIIALKMVYCDTPFSYLHSLNHLTRMNLNRLYSCEQAYLNSTNCTFPIFKPEPFASPYVDVERIVEYLHFLGPGALIFDNIILLFKHPPLVSILELIINDIKDINLSPTLPLDLHHLMMVFNRTQNIICRTQNNNLAEALCKCFLETTDLFFMELIANFQRYKEDKYSNLTDFILNSLHCDIANVLKSVKYPNAEGILSFIFMKKNTTLTLFNPATLIPSSNPIHCTESKLCGVP